MPALKSAAALCLCSLAHAGWEPVEVVATSYCSCAICTPGKGITADGTRTSDEPYGVAVAPNAECSIPLGSWIYIPAGEGYLDQSRAEDRVFKVDDRMPRKRASLPRIDLRYRTHWSAQQFGRKTITVWVWRD